MPKQSPYKGRGAVGRGQQLSRESRSRALIFFALSAVCILAVCVYAFNAAQRASLTSAMIAADTPVSPDVLAEVVSQPHLVFLHSPSGDAYRRVAVVPLDDVAGRRYLTPLQCQRVYFQADQGLCLGSNSVSGMPTSYTAYNFDAAFRVGATYDQPGLPIRVRLSRDGSRGSTTVFVTGDSYSSTSFSTRTSLIDTRAGQQIANMEQFSVERDGSPFQSVDFNFWGVTFAADGDRFYATLGTGGKTFLIEGSLSARHARVLDENVECPALSPDNTRIAFKERTGDAARAWQLSILDLASMTRSRVPGESRSIDDQAEWLDDNHILYSAQEDGTIAVDIWVASLDGSEQPHIFVRQALSPAVVR